MYLKLANIAQNSGEKLFKTRPNFHYLSHIILDAQKRKSRRSAGWDMCFMDEDFVKVNLKMLRMVHPNTASLNLLRRHLVGLKESLQRHNS